MAKIKNGYHNYLTKSIQNNKLIKRGWLWKKKKLKYKQD